jgi:hypothetical protein
MRIHLLLFDCSRAVFYTRISVLGSPLARKRSPPAPSLQPHDALAPFALVVRLVLAVLRSRRARLARFVFIAPTMPRAWSHIADPLLPAIVGRRGQAKFDQRLFLRPRRTSHQFDRFPLQFGIVRVLDFTHPARIVPSLYKSEIIVEIGSRNPVVSDQGHRGRLRCEQEEHTPRPKDDSRGVRKARAAADSVVAHHEDPRVVMPQGSILKLEFQDVRSLLKVSTRNSDGNRKGPGFASTRKVSANLQAYNARGESSCH